jgi:hypothetical protein
MAVMCLGMIGLALSASPSHAGGMAMGIVACERCTGIAGFASRTLFGFQVERGELDALPDVLYDTRAVGGINLGGASTGDPVNVSWLLPPNWRRFPNGRDIQIAVSLQVGTVAFDAGFFVYNQDFTAVAQHALCAFGGGSAPLVRDIPGGHAVEWNPVLEENPTDLIGGGCTIGGDAGRGFVIGYNVYRLDASTHPAPTLREFLVEGWAGHADVLKLDFNVADPDGLSGSDLDPTDNLILRNPDGRPDTEDEVLVYLDGMVGSAASWYRLQPVVRGSQAFFDTGRTGAGGGVPANRLDLDVNRTRESVDIARDGFVEFIDPSGRGLGLTHGGEIASSFHPGLGVPPAGRMGCDGLPQAAGETNCVDGLDDDGDGLVDCVDPDCLFDPGCPREDCDSGIDDDGDGLVDCADADCESSPTCIAEDCMNGIDDDGNGLVDCFDADCCGDAACLAPPPDVARLDVAKPAIGSDEVVVTWTPSPPLRPAARYDVLSGCIARRPLPPGPPLPGCLWQDRSIVAAGCQADDAGSLWWRDARPIDADVFGIYYLVREQSRCGVAGSYGSDSRGGMRAPGPGDCAR